jgi:hypothetical protein
MAQNYVRHLRRVMKDAIETGNRSYCLSPALGKPFVSRSVLNWTFLNPRVVAKLKGAIARQAVDSD